METPLLLDLEVPRVSVALLLFCKEPRCAKASADEQTTMPAERIAT